MLIDLDLIISFYLKLIFFQVVHNVGLCIALWDITKIEDSFIFPGDGASHSIGNILSNSFIFPGNKASHSIGSNILSNTISGCVYYKFYKWTLFET